MAGHPFHHVRSTEAEELVGERADEFWNLTLARPYTSPAARAGRVDEGTWLMTVPVANGEERAAAYAACRRRVRELLGGISEAQAGAIVPACPDWTIRNLSAHLAGVCRDLAERNLPAGDVQAWVDRQVAERAGRSVTALLDEWDEFGSAFEAMIATRPERTGALLYDVIAHEHDAASALGLIGDRTSNGIHLSIDIIAAMIDGDLTKAGLPAVRFTDGTRAWEVGQGSVQFTMEAETFELMRALGSRRSIGQLEAMTHSGDLNRFLPGIAHLPLPVTDLVE